MDRVQALSVRPAIASEQPVVARLLQLYLHDFSGFATARDAHGLIGPDGLFSYPSLSSYWDGTPDRWAFLFHVDDAPAGFALVNDWPPSGRAVDQVLAEFFVARKYRRTGIGRSAASALFRRKPGFWELGVAAYNLPALAFWRATLSGLVHDLEESAGDGHRWAGTIFRFRSGLAR